MKRHVFISYVREDRLLVDALVADLRRHGIDVWLDRERIHPGERWRDAIRTAIRNGAMFVACFSREYENRQRSYMNEELTLAIEELRMRPTERAWFIPVLLSACQIPNRSIGAGETLSDIHWLDLSSDWENGVASLVQVARDSAILSRSGPDRLPVPLQRVLDAASDGLEAMKGWDGNVVEIPEYLTAAVFDSLGKDFSTRRDSVTNRDIRFWSSGDSLVDHFLRHSFTAAANGCVVTQLVLISRSDLDQDWERIVETLEVYITGGVAVAVTVLDDLTEQLHSSELDFTLYDGGKAIMFLRRANTPRVAVLTTGTESNSQAHTMIARQVRTYECLLEHCAMVSDSFKRDHLGAVTLGARRSQPMSVIQGYDDVASTVERLHREARVTAG